MTIDYHILMPKEYEEEFAEIMSRVKENDVFPGPLKEFLEKENVSLINKEDVMIIEG